MLRARSDELWLLGLALSYASYPVGGLVGEQQGIANLGGDGVVLGGDCEDERTPLAGI